MFIVCLLMQFALLSESQTNLKSIPIAENEYMVSAHQHANGNYLLLTLVMSPNKKVGLSDFLNEKYNITYLNNKFEAIWKSEIKSGETHSGPTEKGGLITSPESNFAYFIGNTEDKNIPFYQINLSNGSIKVIKKNYTAFTPWLKNQYESKDYFFGAITTKTDFLIIVKTLEGKIEFKGFEHANPEKLKSISISLSNKRDFTSEFYGKRFNSLPIWELFEYNDGKAFFYSKMDRLNYDIAEVDVTNGSLLKSYSFKLDLLGSYPSYESLQNSHPFNSHYYIMGFPKISTIQDDYLKGEFLKVDRKSGKILVSGTMNSSKKSKNDNLVPTGCYAAIISNGTVEKTLIANFKDYKKEFDQRGGYANAYVNNNLYLHVHDWYGSGFFAEKDGKLVLSESKMILHGPADAYFKAKALCRENEKITNSINLNNDISDFKSIRKNLYYCVLPTTYLFEDGENFVLIEGANSKINIKKF